MSYQPKTGTKVALAFAALKSGPKTGRQLAEASKTSYSNVNAMLFLAIENKAVHKVQDARHVVHYALTSKKLPTGFKAMESELQRAQERVPYNINPADPFGLVAQRAAAAAEDSAQQVAAALSSPGGGQTDPVSRPQHIVSPATCSSGATQQPLLAGHAADTTRFSRGQLVIAHIDTGAVFLAIGHQSLYLDPGHVQKLRACLIPQEQA